LGKGWLLCATVQLVLMLTLTTMGCWCFMHLTFFTTLCNTDASDVCAIKITYLLTALTLTLTLWWFDGSRGGGESSMVVTTLISIACGLWRRVVLKLRRRQLVTYITVPWEWLPRCVTVGQRE